MIQSQKGELRCVISKKQAVRTLARNARIDEIASSLISEYLGFTSLIGFCEKQLPNIALSNMLKFGVYTKSFFIKQTGEYPTNWQKRRKK